MLISDTKLGGKEKTRKMLTSHDDRDRHQRAGDVQREPGTVDDERIKDNPERLPAADHTERNQDGKKIHRHRSLHVHGDKEKREQETRGDLERYLKDQIYEEERIDRICPVCVFL